MESKRNCCWLGQATRLLPLVVIQVRANDGSRGFGEANDYPKDCLLHVTTNLPPLDRRIGFVAIVF